MLHAILSIVNVMRSLPGPGHFTTRFGGCWLNFSDTFSFSQNVFVFLLKTTNMLALLLRPIIIEKRFRVRYKNLGTLPKTPCSLVKVP